MELNRPRRERRREGRSEGRNQNVPFLELNHHFGSITHTTHTEMKVRVYDSGSEWYMSKRVGGLLLEEQASSDLNISFCGI